MTDRCSQAVCSGLPSGRWATLYGGVPAAGKLLAWDWRGSSAAALCRRGAAELAAAWDSLAQLFSPALRRTTVLLQLVWTADTFAYYGVVLLAATVSLMFSTPNDPVLAH